MTVSVLPEANSIHTMLLATPAHTDHTMLLATPAHTDHTMLLATPAHTDPRNTQQKLYALCCTLLKQKTIEVVERVDALISPLLLTVDHMTCMQLRDSVGAHPV
eukprot:scpid108494/ scgid10882/ 